MLEDDDDPALRAAIQASLNEVPTEPKIEQDWSVALAELEGMGFTDKEKNLRVLRSTNGDMQEAVDQLLGDT